MPSKKSGRYQAPSGPEGQTQAGSRGRVLRNLLGIARKREMDRIEFEALLQTQTDWLERITQETRFTAALLCNMHREWLGGIYEWAGQYRTVELEKNGFHWPPAYRVAENMATFEEGLLARHTPCRSAPLPEVAQSIAEVHAELLLIHPFRDGNGRLARWLADIMALQAGYPPPQYQFTSRGATMMRARYLAAVQQGYLLEYAALTNFFAEAIRRRFREDN